MEFDKAVADRLQKLLEKYVPPTAIVPRAKRKKLRLFRDETELASSSNLSDEIMKALEVSRFLIVICSKSTKESLWCRQEIEYFKELHEGSTSNILTLLIEGEPAEVFPRELCFETYSSEGEDGSSITETREVEPLATNIIAPTKKQSLKKLNQEYLRLVAPLLGCRYDDLFNRNQRRRNRRNMLIASSLIVFLVLFGIYSSIMIVQINTQRAEALRNLEEAEVQRAEADTQRGIALENLEEVKSLLLSNAIDYAQRLNEQGARSRAVAVLLGIYENIDANREDADFLYARFRDVAVDTLYYNDMTLPFVRHDLSGEVLQINVIPEQELAVIKTEDVLYKMDIVNGEILEIYSPPEGETYLAMNTHKRYIIAYTDAGSVIAINAETNEEVISEGLIQSPYTVDEILIHYNEQISAFTIVSLFTGRTGGCIDFCCEEYELATLVDVVIIPLELPTLQGEKDIQIIGYLTDAQTTFRIPYGFKISENGRFLALKHQYRTVFQIEDGDAGDMAAVATNSYIRVIDIEKFDYSLDPNENSLAMVNQIDMRKNGEDLYIIGNYSISNDGVLKVDGWIWEEQEGQEEARLIPRTVVYDTLNEVLLLDEQLGRREYLQPFNGEGREISWDFGVLETGLDGDLLDYGWGIEELYHQAEALLNNQLQESSLLIISNQYHYELTLHLAEVENRWVQLGIEDLIVVLDKNYPDYLSELEEMRIRYNFIDEEVMVQERKSDRWLLYLCEREEGRFVQLHHLYSDEGEYWEHLIPNDFNILYSFVYDDFPSGMVIDLPADNVREEKNILGRVIVILVGEHEGNSKVITIRKDAHGNTMIREDLQTLDNVATAGAVALEQGRVIIGHLDGTLLMYNFGISHHPTRDEVTVTRVFENTVFHGQERTEIALHRVAYESYIYAVSYNEDRTLVFGAEVFGPDGIEFLTRYHLDRIYNIWCLETGNIVKSFDFDVIQTEYVIGGKRLFDIQINREFTYAVVSTFVHPSRRFYIIEIDSGDVIHQYEMPAIMDVFFGIGSEPHKIWIFYEDTLLLEVIDILQEQVISQKYVSERIPGSEAGFGTVDAFYSHVYYSIGSDLIVFRGSVDMIYSFTSEKIIFLGNDLYGNQSEIEEVLLDNSVVYLSGSFFRIELVPEALFEALRNSIFVDTMTDEDRSATGLYIFD